MDAGWLTTRSEVASMGEFRWKVACINWGLTDAPKAMAYRLWNGWLAECEEYFPTWREAYDHADHHARTTKNGDNND